MAPVARVAGKALSVLEPAIDGLTFAFSSQARDNYNQRVRENAESTGMGRFGGYLKTMWDDNFGNSINTLMDGEASGWDKVMAGAGLALNVASLFNPYTLAAKAVV
jgi:hypothetical protein